jgi:hypothetical protein
MILWGRAFRPAAGLPSGASLAKPKINLNPDNLSAPRSLGALTL